MQMLYIASQLTYLAVAANFGSILTVLVCCAAMVLFIRQFRLYEFEPTASSVVRVKQPAREQFLTKVNLPFSLQLGKFDLIHSEINFLIYSTSYFPCLFVVCQEMTADVVNTLINKPWHDFVEILTTEVKMWPNLQIYSEERFHESKCFKVQNILKDQPRSAYALVAFHMRTDSDEFGDQDPAAIISLIHLPDRYCNAPATTLFQYLKFKDGRVLNLKPLYSTEDRKSQIPDTGERDESHSNLGNTNCVICWNFPATHVLLPCRHACLCVSCFKRVENCPVCRTRVISFFMV